MPSHTPIDLVARRAGSRALVNEPMDEPPSAGRASALQAAAGRVGMAGILVAALASPAAARPQDAPRKSAVDVMTGLQQKYKQTESKFDDLAKRIEKEVRAAIDARTWIDSASGASESHDHDHPFFTLVNALSEAAKSDAKRRSKNPPDTQKLLTRFPWDDDLELVQGLAYGSDRAIPDHESGFINLGSATAYPGLPELPVNLYLYGFDEIVGWQYHVKGGKKLAHEGRTPKDPPQMASDMPSWEKVRAYVQGNLPNTQLYATPWLTHCIHARLTERRRTAAGQAEPMDDLLALMDSHWNGFYFQPPYAKERVALVAPLHDLYADRKSFVFQFPPSAKLESVGDLPFISVNTLQQYAQVMLDEKILPEDFIASTGPASAATSRFEEDNRYITRYKCLIDEIVRAILAPGSPFPAYLESCDFKSGKAPETRAATGNLDVPRKYALVLWAWSNKDPAKLADFLYDNLLDQDAGRFPSDAKLQFDLATVVRQHESEMLKAITDQIARDRGEGSVPGDFEREFSPYPTYLALDGLPQADFLVHSFQTFHESAAAVVRDAAYAVASKELQ